jgi:four helix bundle protein
MDNKEFSKQLENRTKKFAISIIKLSVLLPNTPEGKVIRNQITKSGTSIGANYREANRARSKADFSNKVKICESEASETNYWLEIIDELNWIEKSKTNELIKEADELLAIFTSISKTLKLKILPTIGTLGTLFIKNVELKKYSHG